MNTLQLNPNPTFKAEVEITVPGQEQTGTIGLTFKYRTRDQVSAWLDSLKEQFDESGNVVRKQKTTSEAFPEFVLGWSLAEDFNAGNISIFLDNYPSSYREIFAKYLKLLISSRVKN